MNIVQKCKEDPKLRQVVRALAAVTLAIMFQSFALTIIGPVFLLLQDPGICLANRYQYLSFGSLAFGLPLCVGGIILLR